MGWWQEQGVPRGGFTPTRNRYGTDAAPPTRMPVTEEEARQIDPHYGNYGDPGVTLSPEEEAQFRAQFPAVFNRPEPEMEKFGGAPPPQGWVPGNPEYDRGQNEGWGRNVTPAPEQATQAGYGQASPGMSGWGTPEYAGPVAAPAARGGSGYGSIGGSAALATHALGGMFGMGFGTRTGNPGGAFGTRTGNPGGAFGTRTGNPGGAFGTRTGSPYGGFGTRTGNPGGSTLGNVGNTVAMTAPTGQTKSVPQEWASRYASRGATFSKGRYGY